MKILTPINSPEEVEMLVGNGAEEFYCGLSPEEWVSRHGMAVWLNRRSPMGGNIRSLAALNQLVRNAHDHRIPVYLTLNAPYYTESQYPYLLDMVERLVFEIGVDALIVTDIGLVSEIRDRGIPIEIHLSSVGAALNSEAVKFYRELGVRRVILPRSVTLTEIQDIALRVKGTVGLEVFILNEGCAFEEGFCHTTHNAVGAFCSSLARWDYHFYHNGQGNTTDRDVDVDEHIRDYREWIWYINSCGCSLTPEGLPYGPCGLCAIPDLAAIGVDAIKIIGREASPFRKLASIQLVKAVVDLARKGTPREEVAAKARSIRKDSKSCDLGYMCYYRPTQLQESEVRAR
jgi:putative protease